MIYIYISAVKVNIITGGAALSAKHRYYVTCLSNLTKKSQHSYCLYLMCIWFHQTTARLSGFVCRLTSWNRELVMSQWVRFSLYFIFIPLSDNRNSKIYQWKLFYWELRIIENFIKIHMLAQRGNKCSNKQYRLWTCACSEEVSCPVLKNVNRFV